MKKFSLFLSLLFISFTTNAQTFGWAIQQSGNDWESVFQIAEDGGGNIYETGNFWATVDFDPSASVLNLTSAGLTDVFFCKLDASGSLVWAKSFGGSAFEDGENIALDAGNNIYVAGKFNSTADFDPDANTFNLTSLGMEDAFIAKYANNGDFIWAFQLGNTGADYVQGLVESNGYLYATGYFQGTVDFDPDTTAIYNLTASGPDAAFILKLDDDGNLIWAKSISGTSSTLAMDIAVDSSGNVFTGGEFWGTCDFDPGSGVQNHTATGFDADAYLLKLDTDGNFLWVDIFSGNNNQWVQAIDMNANQDVSVCGAFEGTADFDPGSGGYSITSNGNYDMFTVKLYSADGSLAWAVGTGGTSNEQVYDLSVSNSGDHYLTGYFSGTVDFDPGPNTYNLTDAGVADAFFQHLNAAGEFEEAYGFGGISANNTGNSILADNVGRITFAGGFEYTADFDPGAGVTNLTSNFGTLDCFVVQFNSCTPSEAFNGISICEGDSIYVGGAFQTAAGEYLDYYVSASGCDSILTTELTLDPLPPVNYSWTFADTVCLNNPPYPLTGGTPPGGTYSGDGVSGITFTPSAAGPGTHIIAYSYTDTNGCMNAANDVVYVDVCTSVQEEKNSFAVSVFPNPATDVVNIAFSGSQNQNVTWELLNLLGEKIKTEEVKFSPGKQILSLDVSSVPKGIYRLVLLNEDQQSRAVFLVVQ